MAGAREYRERMRQAAAAGTLEVWYEHLEAGDLLEMTEEEVRRGQLSKREHRRTRGQVVKARTRDSVRVFTRRVGKVHDELRFVADPPLIVPIEDLVKPGSVWEQSDVLIKQLLSSYRQTLGVEHHPLEEFRYVHAARKVVGVGSVGTRCYILLLVGRDDADPLILQVKEAEASVLERFVGKSEYAHHGQRVVAGQRLMQGASDAFLGWQRIQGLDGKTYDFYVRQLHDWKGITEVDEMLVPGATLYSRTLRGDPGPGSRPVGGSDRHSLVSGQGRDLRPGHRPLRDRLRRPERAGLRGARPGGAIGSTHRRDRRLAAPPTHRYQWHPMASRPPTESPPR